MVIERVEHAHHDLNGDQDPKQRRHDAASRNNGGLTNEFAEARMNDLQREAERAAAEIGMGHGEIAGREPHRQRQSQRPDLQGIADAAKHQRFVLDRDTQRHADAVADIFFEPGRPGEAFRGMDHLRKAVAARADAGPDLAAARRILGHRHDHRDTGLGAGRQRPADDARKLRQPPAGAAKTRLLDRADIDDGLAIGKTLGEAPPDRQRQPAPLLVGQQIVEAAVVEQDGVRGGRCGKPW